jgi:hypothetical protein
MAASDLCNHRRLSSTAVRVDGTFNKPSSLLDLYTPRWVKGVGMTKQGMCPICAEDASRGGGGTKVWLSMKQSAFKSVHLRLLAVHVLTFSYSYHMMYKHGGFFDVYFGDDIIDSHSRYLSHWHALFASHCVSGIYTPCEDGSSSDDHA